MKAAVAATGKKESVKEEMSSMFQRQRVDLLLGELTRKFPVKQPSLPSSSAAAPEQSKQPAAGSNPVLSH